MQTQRQLTAGGGGTVFGGSAVGDGGGSDGGGGAGGGGTIGVSGGVACVDGAGGWVAGTFCD